MLVPKKIIAKCKRRDQRAFKQLYQACLPYVYTIVKDYVADADLRKDIVQDVFARVFLKLDSFDDRKGAFQYWLRKIAVNECRMFLRDKKRAFDYDELESIPAEKQGREEINLTHLDPDRLEQFLAKMPNGYRRVVQLILLEGYSHEEAAHRLGISAASSRSQLSRAKRWLQDSSLTHLSSPYGRN